MDKENVKLMILLKEIEEKLGKEAVPFSIQLVKINLRLCRR